MSLNWSIKFKFKEEHTASLVDLKNIDLFDYKYPVFKMLLARELLNSTSSNFFHVKRKEYTTEIIDPDGKEIPLDSCIFIFGISKELGMLKALFFPQPDERFVLAALDEVWITVLEKFDLAQRLTVLTNVIASLVTNQEAWSQVYLIY